MSTLPVATLGFDSDCFHRGGTESKKRHVCDILKINRPLLCNFWSVLAKSWLRTLPQETHQLWMRKITQIWKCDPCTARPQWESNHCFCSTVFWTIIKRWITAFTVNTAGGSLLRLMTLTLFHLYSPCCGAALCIHNLTNCSCKYTAETADRTICLVTQMKMSHASHTILTVLLVTFLE